MFLATPSRDSGIVEKESIHFHINFYVLIIKRSFWVSFATVLIKVFWWQYNGDELIKPLKARLVTQNHHIDTNQTKIYTLNIEGWCYTDPFLETCHLEIEDMSCRHFLGHQIPLEFEAGKLSNNNVKKGEQKDATLEELKIVDMMLGNLMT